MGFNARIEETVSEILSFRRIIVSGQVFAADQTENEDEEITETKAK